MKEEALSNRQIQPHGPPLSCLARAPKLKGQARNCCHRCWRGAALRHVSCSLRQSSSPTVSLQSMFTQRQPNTTTYYILNIKLYCITAPGLLVTNIKCTMERDPQEIIRELQARLEEERRGRLEEHRGRLEEHRGRLEEHRGRLEEQNRRIVAEGAISKTALVPFLLHCYHILCQPVSVQAVSTLRSSGGLTSIKGRYYPRELRPWTDFVQLHDESFSELAALFGNEALFPSRAVIEQVRRDLSPSPLADEEDLRPLEMFAIELRAKNVITEYLARKQPQAVARVIFRSNPYSLRRHSAMATSQDASPAQRRSQSQRRGSSRGRSRGGSRDRNENRDRSRSQRQRLPTVSPPLVSGSGDGGGASLSKRPATSPPPGSPERDSTKRYSSTERRSVPDRWCIAENADKVRHSLFTIEYKAAHKVMPDTLTAVLDGRPSDTALFADAAEAGRSAEEKRQRSNLVQVASAEEENVVELDTVAATRGTRSADSPSRSLKTAQNRVAQVLTQAFHYMVDYGLSYSYVTTGESFIFLYVDFVNHPSVLYYRLLVPKQEIRLPEPQYDVSASHQQAEQHNAEVAKQTPIALVLTLILLALRRASLGFEAKDRVKKLVKAFPKPYGNDLEQADQSEGPGPAQGQGQGQAPGYTPAPQQESRQGGEGSSGDVTYTARTPQPSYCTQKCMLGLRFGRPLDLACPNIALHQPSNKAGSHGLTCKELLSVLKEQLTANLDDGCAALDGHGKFGAVGALFKVTAYPQGYTFVAKGVQDDDRDRLDWEERVYQQLAALQGGAVPVCLGLVDLRRAYVLAGGARVVRLMLLSYAGETARPEQVADEAVVLGLREMLQAHGVEHGDLRRANVLWSEEWRRLMVVDFDRARLRAKRKRAAEDVAGLQADRQPAAGGLLPGQLWDC